MPKKGSPIQQRRKIALNRGVVYQFNDFEYVCRKAKHRPAIIVEGDSWVTYPRKWIIGGQSINLSHHLEKMVEYTDTVNVLRVSSNGDTAIAMSQGKQFADMEKMLRKNKDYISMMLFSAGGNDIVGESDLEPLIYEYTDQATFMECIKIDRFNAKLDRIIDAYRAMISLWANVVPQAKIISHTYDIATPWKQGAEFFWGLYKSKSWVWPTMEKREIPIEFRLPIIQYMLETFASRLLALQHEPISQNRFFVVDTQGILVPGNKSQWLNEIHPTPRGFKKIFEEIYPLMRVLETNLP